MKAGQCGSEVGKGSASVPADIVCPFRPVIVMGNRRQHSVAIWGRRGAGWCGFIPCPYGLKGDRGPACLNARGIEVVGGESTKSATFLAKVGARPWLLQCAVQESIDFTVEVLHQVHNVRRAHQQCSVDRTVPSDSRLVISGVLRTSPGRFLCEVGKIDHLPNHLLQRAEQFSADSQLSVTTPSTPLSPVSCKNSDQSTCDRQGTADKGGKKSAHAWIVTEQVLPDNRSSFPVPGHTGYMWDGQARQYESAGLVAGHTLWRLGSGHGL